MTKDKIVNQPTLFEPNAVDVERLLLYALGEFQSRGKVLAERQLALDRLRGAFKRAAEKFQTDELSDEKLAETLEKLGAGVVRKPSFVAKHPFRVTVQNELAKRAADVYQETVSKNVEDKS
jgi:histone H3/H4